MNKHPRHHAIASMIHCGNSDRTIASTLTVDRRAVAKIRRMLGVDPITCVVTPEEQLARNCAEPDENGHVIWTGSISSSGVPRMGHQGHDIAVTRYVFEQRTDRYAVGVVKADCGVSRCVAASHLVDDIERRTVRLLMRNLLGYPQPWITCQRCGADWSRDGRVEPSLELYCRCCSTSRSARLRGGVRSSDLKGSE